MALDPTLKIIAPWKDTQFLRAARPRDAPSNTPRSTASRSRRRRRRSTRRTATSGTSATKAPRSSIPTREPNWEQCLTMTVPPAKAPDKAEIVEVDFERGNPVAVNGKRLAAARDDRRAEQDRRQARRRLTRAGGEPPGRDEEPRRLRDAGRHDPLRGPQGAGADLHRARHATTTSSSSPCSTPSWSTTASGSTRCARRCRRSSTTPTRWSPARRRCGCSRAARRRRRHSAAHALRPAAGQLRMEGYDVTAARGFIDLFGLPMKVRGLEQGRKGRRG